MHAIYSNTYTKMNLSTVKWAQWDKTQSRELLGLFICVCIALCTIIAYNIAHNRPDNFPSYPPNNHHSSDDVYLREGGIGVLRRSHQQGPGAEPLWGGSGAKPPEAESFFSIWMSNWSGKIACSLYLAVSKGLMGVQYYRGTDRKGEEQPALPPPLNPVLESYL